MVKYAGTEETVEATGPQPPRLATTGSAVPDAETERIRPEFRSRLALLDSQGLLWMGVWVILQEAGFRPEESRQHCWCTTCAQRRVERADRSQALRGL